LPAKKEVTQKRLRIYLPPGQWLTSGEQMKGINTAPSIPQIILFYLLLLFWAFIVIVAFTKVLTTYQIYPI
jgi:hypothetical protein